MSAQGERRLQVLRALIAIRAYPSYPDDQEILPFHIRWFGIPECVTTVSIGTIKSDLRVMLDDGLVERNGRGFEITDVGRALVALTLWFVDSPLSQTCYLVRADDTKSLVQQIQETRRPNRQYTDEQMDDLLKQSVPLHDFEDEVEVTLERARETGTLVDLTNDKRN